MTVYLCHQKQDNLILQRPDTYGIMCKSEVLDPPQINITWETNPSNADTSQI